MESIRYNFKGFESIPLYDKESKTYSVMVRGELVEIPEDIFHKLFEEERYEYNPKLFKIAGNTSNSNLVDIYSEKIVDSVINQDSEFGQQIYEDLKNAIKVILAAGFTKSETFQFYKEMLNNNMSSKKLADKMLQLIQKILDEI